MATKAASSPATPATSRPPSTNEQLSGASTPTLSVPNTNIDKSPDDSSKLRTFLGILKKFIGVADIASVRFSLPPQLLEPIPNLEYWQYLDRPETFASIPDSDDPLGRLLGALRFWFTKDLKYVKGRACKPYNSVLGEFFRCTWEVKEDLPPLLGKATTNQASEEKPVTISFLTEQTSHHPPVSAYWIHCPEKGISARGFDQLTGNFTGTRIRVGPGEYNRGIYLTLHNFDDETYNLTHPIAHLGGFLRGALNITVADACYVTCPKTKLKVILHYLEEGWLGKAQNRMQGVVFKYDPDNDSCTKIKDVPEADIVARIEGCWHEQIYYTVGNKPFDKSEKRLIVDLAPLFPMPKILPPENDQLPNESRIFWSSLTNAINSKQWGQATAAKTEIEERQRQKAAERKARNIEWRPRFFTEAVGPRGKPELTKEGKEVIDKLHAGDYRLEPSVETGA